MSIHGSWESMFPRPWKFPVSTSSGTIGLNDVSEIVNVKTVRTSVVDPREMGSNKDRRFGGFGEPHDTRTSRAGYKWTVGCASHDCHSTRNASLPK